MAHTKTPTIERGPTLSENPVLPKEQVWEGVERDFEIAKQEGGSISELSLRHSNCSSNGC